VLIFSLAVEQHNGANQNSANDTTCNAADFITRQPAMTFIKLEISFYLIPAGPL
jgi:hypothetical protein